MAIYRRKPTTVDAEQFTDATNPPRGVSPHAYLDFSVTTLQGMNVGVRVGEWIVREPSNPERFYPIADAEFRKIYEPTYGAASAGLLQRD